MSELEAWGLAYLLAWTIGAHWYAIYRYQLWKRHRRRSIAAQKAAATRKQNAQRNPKPPAPPKPPKPRAKKQKTLDDRIVQAESAWFRLLTGEEADPDYNEVDLSAAERYKVRRFPGGASEYSQRDRGDGSV